MAEKVDLAFGEIALKTGKVSKETLDKCVEIQHTLPSWKPLGVVIMEQGYLTEDEVSDILKIQKRNMEAMSIQRRQMGEDNIFGRIAIKLGYVTLPQVEECLRVQLELAKDYLLRLGEIMIKKGYLNKKQLTEIITYQEKRLITCPQCTTRYNMILFNGGVKFPCYKCEKELSIPKD
jgi:hypothetical protein